MVCQKVSIGQMICNATSTLQLTYDTVKWLGNKHFSSNLQHSEHCSGGRSGQWALFRWPERTVSIVKIICQDSEHCSGNLSDGEHCLGDLRGQLALFRWPERTVSIVQMTSQDSEHCSDNLSDGENCLGDLRGQWALFRWAVNIAQATYQTVSIV